MTDPMTHPTADSTPEGQADDSVSLERQRHDRRYKIFAVVFAVVVLLFAALSITVVIISS